MKTTTTILCASLAALAAVPAHAQGAQAQSNFRYGVSASILAPLNDMGIESSTGFGLAVFVEYKFTDFMGTRLRYEYTKFGNKEATVTSSIDPMYDSTNSYSSTMQSPSADLIIGNKDKGLYFFVGAGTTQRSIDAVFQYLNGELSGEKKDNSFNLNGFAGSVGAGYAFTKNMGLEAKYTKINMNTTTAQNNQAYIQASFVLTF